MRTVGEILRKARLEKKFSVEEVEQRLRIRKKFLLALEENNWRALPSLPYIKGFLGNYSAFLDLKPQEMLAIFRRQFQEQEKAGLLPEGMAKPLDEPIVSIRQKGPLLLGIAVFLVVFFGYLSIQFRTMFLPPPLIITTPKEGEIVNTPTVLLQGETSEDSVLTINGENLALESEGKFSTTLQLTPGINIFRIETTNKHGRKRTISRTIQAELSP